MHTYTTNNIGPISGYYPNQTDNSQLIHDTGAMTRYSMIIQSVTGLIKKVGSESGCISVRYRMILTGLLPKYRVSCLVFTSQSDQYYWVCTYMYNYYCDYVIHAILQLYISPVFSWQSHYHKCIHFQGDEL